MIDTDVSVVIPAFNEGENIKGIVKNLYAFLNSNFKGFEIIVVDDGSADTTVRQLASLAPGIPLKVLSNGTNKGKGYSVKRGVESAEKDYVLLCDADLSTPIHEILRFMPYFQRGFDVVIGSRALPDSRLAVRQGILRRSMGKTFNFFLQLLLFRGIRDTQCGFKCFKRDAAKAVFSRMTVSRFCFDAEALFIARSWGMKVKEVGVEWANRADSRVSIIADSLSMFADLFRIRINAWRGIYGRVKGKDNHSVFPGAVVCRDADEVPAQGPQKTLL